jgi:N-acetylglucosaminyldiphosphoundecaprenol N-acetyl-beta-D-mannosaminyltransferase
MARQKGQVQGVMLGIGAALAVYAGVRKRAPVWMQRNSLEWFYRLLQEPRRLGRRYLVTNCLFLLLLGRDILVHNFRRLAP